MWAQRQPRVVKGPNHRTLDLEFGREARQRRQRSDADVLDRSLARPEFELPRGFFRACLRSKYQPAVPSSRRSSLPQSLPFIPNVEICCVCQSTSVIARSIACVAWEYSLLFGLASQV